MTGPARQLDPLDHVASLRTEVGRCADLVATGDLEAGIEHCPGWTVRQLALHLGGVHRWALTAATTGAQPTSRGDQPDGDSAADLSAWLRRGGDALAAVLGELDPDAPTWHPFPVPHRAAVWPRRQAMETMVHRWDLEHALGAETAFDPALASDGIDEYFEMMLPRRLSRDELSGPASSLHVHCTDVPGEWLARYEGGRLLVTREHAKGDAALRGPAAAIFLALWGRTGGASGSEIIGDQAAASEWLALGGV